MAEQNYEQQEIPVNPEEVVPVEAEQKPKPADDMADLFEVPQDEDNDMYTDDLFEVDDADIMGGDNLTDLTAVQNEDIMGNRPKPKPKYRRVYRPAFVPPPTVGGIQ